ncbi:MAG: AAA family ATPase, partial [Candidatus Gracilibacteria bacterium]|nr:AAA family ATPase [Candidatus Gracilibacteria bacterium]
MIVGLFLRHYKCYHSTNYIPICNGQKFASFVGQNGIGKSSILELLDYFFSEKRSWNLNLKASKEGGVYQDKVVPFVSPVFVIEKIKVEEGDREIFAELSNFFVNYKDKESGYLGLFIKHRNDILCKFPSDKYFFITVGLKWDRSIFFHVFRSELYTGLHQEEVGEKKDKDDLIQDALKNRYKRILDYIYENYLYI